MSVPYRGSLELFVKLLEYKLSSISVIFLNPGVGFKKMEEEISGKFLFLESITIV